MQSPPPSPTPELAACHLPDSFEVGLILQFTENPMLFASSQQLRTCLLKNVLWEMCPGDAEMPPIEEVNLEPLKRFDPVLEAIYTSPTITFWEKTQIALDVFEYLMLDPLLWMSANQLQGITGKEPFIIEIVARYDNDLKDHFFPSPGITNRKEDDPRGRWGVINHRLAPFVSIHSDVVRQAKAEGAQLPPVVEEVWDIYVTLRECLDITKKTKRSRNGASPSKV